MAEAREPGVLAAGGLRGAFAAGKWLSAARESEECEACVAFSRKHYPKGLNANFLQGNEAEVITKHIGKFEDREARDIAKAVPDIVQKLKDSAGLTKSCVVADIGAGTGLFLEPLSTAAKRLFAMEISPHFLAYLRKQVKVRRLLNVEVVVGIAQDPGLPADSVDLVFVCDVYHHFEYPKTVCRHLIEALRPGGRLVVIDIIRDEAVIKSHEPGWVTEHVRAGKEVFRSEIESTGFRFVAELCVPNLVENYCLVFERPPHGSGMD